MTLQCRLCMIIMSLSTHKPREPITDRKTILVFGKYKGYSIDDIMETNPQYLIWLHNNNEFFELGHELLDECENSSFDKL